MNLHVQISWQAQHFVNLHVQISWQAQHPGSWKLRTGDFVVRGVSGELDDENWRLCSATLVRGVSVELEAENWQVQHFVNLHVQISSQAQHFVSLEVQIS